MTATAAPAPHRAPDPSATPAVGRNELGVITIDDSVVTKIASRAASEIPDAGAATPRLLGKSLPGAGSLGTRATSLDELPKASAEVDGSVVLIELSISVRWPCSVPAVAQAVRQRVRDRVTELTGLHVAEVTIEVADLVTQLAPPSRVH